MGKTKLKPDFIFRGKKPVAVVLKINDYQELLEELEDIEDLKYLNDIKKSQFDTTDLDDYLKFRGLIV